MSSTIASLSLNQIKSLSTARIAALTTEDARSMTTAQVKVLSAAQVAALETEDLAAMSDDTDRLHFCGSMIRLTLDQLSILSTVDHQQLDHGADRHSQGLSNSRLVHRSGRSPDERSGCALELVAIDCPEF